MSKMANIDLLKTSTGGSQFVNFTNGIVRITVLGENMKNASGVSEGITFEDGLDSAAAHKLAIYSAELTVPDTGVSIPLDNIMGRTRNINDIFNSSGSFAGTTMGTEVLNTTDMTLGFTEDYVYLSDSPKGHIISRDILRAMLLGETFQHFTGEVDGTKTYDTIKVAGSNGTVKRGTKALSNRYFGGLFIHDGKLVVPQATDKDGNPLLKPNARVAAYNTTALTVMIEFMYSFSQEKTNGFRFVYVLNGGVTYNEADDANKVSCTAQILCDPRAITSVWIDGGAPNAIMLDSLKDEMGTPFTIQQIQQKVTEAITAKEVSQDAPIIVYVNKEKAPLTRRRKLSKNTEINKTSGYMLFTCAGIPVPALISEDGANPVLVDTSTLPPESAPESAPGANDAVVGLDKFTSIDDYIFDVYNYEMLNAKFVPYYMPAVKGYYASQMSLPPVEAAEPETKSSYSSYDAEPMSGFRLKR